MKLYSFLEEIEDEHHFILEFSSTFYSKKIIDLKFVRILDKSYIYIYHAFIAIVKREWGSRKGGSRISS